MQTKKIIYFVPLLFLLASFSFSLNVYAQTNSPPNIAVTSPSPGLYLSAIPLVFSGGAIDAQDGVISSQIQWSSNISGFVGTGSGFPAVLPSGDHTITATVTDSGGLTSSHSVSGIIVVNSNFSPVVTINTPSNGGTFASGDPITFQGTAIDDHDGNISEQIFWISNVDGSLGAGASYTTSQLSVGFHAIRAEAYDSLGSKGQINVFIEITEVPSNSPPMVSISSPDLDSTFSEGQSVSFSGSATDPEQGSMNSSIQWTSSIDGFIGTGSSFSKTNLSVGVHTITASVTDNGGLDDSEQVMIRIGYVQRDNISPTVVITKPSSGSELKGKFNIFAEVVGNSSYLVNLKIGNYQSILSSSPYEWSYHSKDLLPGDNTIRVELLDMDGTLVDFDEIIVIKSNNKKVTIDDTSSQKCSPGKEKSGKC